jgi:hypothetical protein
MTVDVTAQIAKRRERVKAELEKDGLYLPPRPKSELPRLPPLLDELDDEKVIRYLVRFTRFQDYVAGQRVEAEIDERAAEHILDVAMASHLAKSWTGSSGDRVAVLKAEALLDKDVQQMHEIYDTAKARRKLLGIMEDSLARDAAVVSRDITRRQGGRDQDRRAERHTA